MGHAWLSLSSFPLLELPWVLHEAIARAVERCMGFRPTDCKHSEWERPAANILKMSRTSIPLSIEMLLAMRLELDAELERRLLFCWESDALLAFLFQRLTGNSIIEKVFDAMSAPFGTPRARLKRIANLCGSTVELIERDFFDYLQVGHWGPMFNNSIISD
jgi:hypothetical protein